MTLIPKDPPVKAPDFLHFLKMLIYRCEWPDGCQVRRGLDAAHIRARGMGGGRRKDTEDNVVILCRRHHIEYDSQMGQSPENQQWMKRALDKRLESEKRQIRAFWRNWGG